MTIIIVIDVFYSVLKCKFAGTSLLSVA